MKNQKSKSSKERKQEQDCSPGEFWRPRRQRRKDSHREGWERREIGSRRRPSGAAPAASWPPEWISAAARTAPRTASRSPGSATDCSSAPSSAFLSAPPPAFYPPSLSPLVSREPDHSLSYISLSFYLSLSLLLPLLLHI